MILCHAVEDDGRPVEDVGLTELGLEASKYTVKEAGLKGHDVEEYSKMPLPQKQPLPRNQPLPGEQTLPNKRSLPHRQLRHSKWPLPL